MKDSGEPETKREWIALGVFLGIFSFFMFASTMKWINTL